MFCFFIKGQVEESCKKPIIMFLFNLCSYTLKQIVLMIKFLMKWENWKLELILVHSALCWLYQT